mmetsp:Transcript_6351/g.17918  ORF Transcript_6351/g.17918 Transcript_6351/m.17918 type:complete len:164 (-) Transcript_6351:158-649(-)
MVRLTSVLLLLVIGTAAQHSEKGVCNVDTGGSCKVFGCNDWRGGAKCDKEAGYKCMCPPGKCSSKDGICVEEDKHAASQYDVNTGSTCDPILGFWGCSADLGPTDCVAGKCLCEAGKFYICHEVPDTEGQRTMSGCSKECKCQKPSDWGSKAQCVPKNTVITM